MSIYTPRGKLSKDVHDNITKGKGKFADKTPQVIYSRDSKGKVRQVVKPGYYNPHPSYGVRNKNGRVSEGNVGLPGIGSGPGNAGDEIWRREGNGSGRDAGDEDQEGIYVPVSRDSLRQFLSELELELIKPGKILKRTGYNWAVVADHGPKSTFALDETVYAAFERQILLETEFEISEIEESDLRYRLAQDVMKRDKDAVVIFIRDISGSVSDNELTMSYDLTEKVEFWLREAYKGKITTIFVPHNHWAWEDTRDGYYLLSSGGGTYFGSAYELVLNMIGKKDYPRQDGVRKKVIDPEVTDIYAVHMTDGGDGPVEKSISLLGQLLPSLTRFCYLKTSFQGFAWEGDDTFGNAMAQNFFEYIAKGKIRGAKASSLDDVAGAISIFFGKKNYVVATNFVR